MDAETARWIAGLSFFVIVALVGVIYWHLRGEISILRKRTHQHASWLTALKGRVGFLERWSGIHRNKDVTDRIEVQNGDDE